MPCCTTKRTGKHLRSPPQPLPFLPSWARFLNTVAARIVIRAFVSSLEPIALDRIFGWLDFSDHRQTPSLLVSNWTAGDVGLGAAGRSMNCWTILRF
jgi:hypothetical protein